MTKGKVMVLGANGRFGESMVQAFLDAGWQVTGQARSPLKLKHSNLTQLQCDAHDINSITVRATFDQTSVVVHALNPSSYTEDQWQADALPMLDVSIGAARVTGALLLMPGTVYNYGHNPPSVITESTPEALGSVFGNIRIMMEKRVAQSGLDSVVLTAGDFFGAGQGVWFDKVITSRLQKGRISWPGPLGTVHAFAYLPDLARAFVLLAGKRASLTGFNKWIMPGYNITGEDMRVKLSKLLGRPVKAGTVPWSLIGVGGVLVPMLRSLWSMRYNWRNSVALEGNALMRELPELRLNTLDDALHAALTALGRLPAGAAKCAT